jgi:hypothetical protein
MIIFGMIGRNINSYMDNYNDDWGGQIRMVCLVVILTRGGMELSFKGKGFTIIFLTCAPQMAEAWTIAGMSTALFGLPILLAFSLGYVIAAVSPAVLVPSWMYLQENGYGVDKEIPTILIAAASFDDIIAILLFGMFSDMEFSKVGTTHHEPYETAYIHVYQIATGIIVGLSFGLILGLSLRNKPNTRPYKFLKLILVLITLIVIIAAVELSGFVESRYIWVLLFGYMLNNWWGKNKPDAYLGFVWTCMSPLLFGSIGAAIDFSELDFSYVPLSITIIIVGGIFRMAATYLVVWQKRFTIKERLVIWVGWIPKATVQAAIGGIVLDRARDEITEGTEEYDDYEKYGQQILTTAILCILMTAPLGAILTSNLGSRWLHKTESK